MEDTIGRAPRFLARCLDMTRGPGRTPDVRCTHNADFAMFAKGGAVKSACETTRRRRLLG